MNEITFWDVLEYIIKHKDDEQLMNKLSSTIFIHTTRWKTWWESQRDKKRKAKSKQLILDE